MQVMRKKYQSASAFTLLELLVVLSIFVIIASLSIANYRGSNRESQLKMATQELVANIKLAQSYALGSKEFVSRTDPRSGQVPSGGWGVHFSVYNPGEYEIVADFDGNHVWDSQRDGLFKEVELPEKISITKLIYRSSTVSNLDIFFEPPDPQTFLNQDREGNATIVLYDDLLATASEVTVNFFGLVEITK